MGKRYVGLALANSMFNGECTIHRKVLQAEQAKRHLSGDVESCCNPSHTATIKAIRERFAIELPIPETPPQVSLSSGDSILVIGVRGLPRLTDRHQYTEAEIASAEFEFALYTLE